MCSTSHDTAGILECACPLGRTARDAGRGPGGSRVYQVGCGKRLEAGPCHGGPADPGEAAAESVGDQALTQSTVNGRQVIYDERGVPHTLTGPSKNASEKVAFDCMNDDLRNGGKYYDGSKNGSGSRYLWQDDQGVLPNTGSVARSER
jgi:hypothetical protein